MSNQPKFPNAVGQFIPTNEFAEILRQIIPAGRNCAELCGRCYGNLWIHDDLTGEDRDCPRCVPLLNLLEQAEKKLDSQNVKD